MTAPTEPAPRTDWEKHVIEAWATVRKHNHSIPDDVLDEMKARLLTPVARVMHMEAVCAVHGKDCGAACNCPRVAMARMSDGTLRHQAPVEQPRTMGLPAEIPDSDLLWRCLTHGYTKAAVEAMLSERDKQVLQERATKAWAEIVNEVQQKGGQTLPRDAQPSVFGKDALSAIRALREWVQAVPDDVAASLPAMPGVDGDWLDRVEAELSVVPEFTHVATHKLQDLRERGYRVTGYAIEKPVEGGQPERGFITAGGFVGWWRDAGVSFTAVAARPVKSIQITQTLSREVEPQLFKEADTHGGAEQPPKVAPVCPNCNGNCCVQADAPHQFDPCWACGGTGTTAARIEGPRQELWDDLKKKLQSVNQERAGCPHCKGQSGYFVGDTGQLGRWTGMAKYLSCEQCDKPSALRLSETLKSPECWCGACDQAVNHGMRSRMSLCPDCGDKRCKRALHHDQHCNNDKGVE